MEQNTKRNERLSTSQKNANKKQWYKDRAIRLKNDHNILRDGEGQISDYKRMSVNYNLFNNQLNLKDFEYVCKPFGAEAGELPATMVNRDISSGKIKALLGMEMKRPFSWRVVATNSEATTRKEQEEFGRIRDFVVAEMLGPIRMQLEQKAAEANAGKELSQEEQEAMQAQIQEELNAQTPLETKKYMEREHQDPAEVMAHQLLEYMMEKTDIRRKFNECFKHLSLSAKEIMYVGILNEEPQAWVINSLRVHVKRSSLSPFIEDGEAMSVKYKMTPSEVLQHFGDQLKNSEIDKIYSSYIDDNTEQDLFHQADLENEEGEYRDFSNVDVTHTLWKSLRKLAFLTYMDENNTEQMMMVDEKYTLDLAAGDVKIEYEWLPESYQTWIINDDIFVGMHPVEGQFKDLNNLNQCKFPYYGVYVDDMNSMPTSPMDRLKVYQYYYNIVMYRLELLLASDKGKKVMMNINAIPDSAGIDMEQWQYFFESSPFMWFDPNQEGTGYADVNTMAKTVDLSLASDIAKYIEFAEYLKRQAGSSVGITEAVEGQAQPGDSVGNNRQNLIQTSNILEPFFDIHNTFKKNVLTALIETAKIAYSGKNAVKLSYVLDDMSIKILELDTEMLENSTLGLFVANSTKAEEAMQTIKQLAHAAMQNQKAELSDILAVIRQEGIVEAEETLKVAEKERKAEQSAIEANKGAQAQEMMKLEQDALQKAHENDKELIVLKEGERRKTVIAQSAITGMSFNPDADGDNDGENDFLEIARDGVNADIKRSEAQLNREKFEQSKVEHTDKMKLEDKKISQSNKTNK
tara:strand:- start:15102 stop:17510 length:2409 start_codon:yes stop_codon:yes gene_type:complete